MDARRWWCILVLVVAFCSCKGQKYEIKNFQITSGVNLIYTASWDPLQSYSSDSSENSSIFYTVYDNLTDYNETPIKQCINITDTSCVLDNIYLFDIGYVGYIVRATVKGQETGESAVKRVDEFDLEKILTAPVMNASRDRQKITVNFQEPPESTMSFNPKITIKYNITHGNGTKEVKRPPTSNTTVFFKTSAPSDARICITAKLVIEDQVDVESKWAEEVCVDSVEDGTIGTSTTPPKEGFRSASQKYEIKNFQITSGVNLIYTASWDPLQSYSSDSSENSSIFYTVYDSLTDYNGTPIKQCINITDTSCVLDNIYLFDMGYVGYIVRATVKGQETGESAVKRVDVFDLEKILTAPVMNASRDRQKITVNFQEPPESTMSFNPKITIKYNITHGNGTKEVERPPTSNTTVFFKTSAPSDARICITAKLVIEDQVDVESKWAEEVCVDSVEDGTIGTSTTPPKEGDYKLHYLIGVLIGSLLILVLLVVILIKKYCRNPLHEVTVELPKDTARVIAMSEDPFVIEDEVSGLKEKFSPIDDTDDFESTSLLNEKNTPAEDRNVPKEKDNVSILESQENDIDEEASCKEELLNDSVESEDIKSECSDQEYDDKKNEDMIQVPLEVHIDNYVRVPEDHSIMPRKTRLESTDSAFWDGHTTLPETESRRPDSGRSLSSIFGSRISVDSFCSADEGYVKIPVQHDMAFAGTI